MENILSGTHCTPSADSRALAAWVAGVGHYITKEHILRNRTIDEYVMIYCTDGVGKCALGDTEYEVRAGDIFLLPPHIVHSYNCDPILGWEIRYMHFAGMYAEKPVILAGFTTRQPVIHLGVHEDIVERFQRILTIIDQKEIHYSLDASCELIVLLAAIRKLSGETMARGLSGFKSVDWQVNSLDDLAAEMGSSKCHFIRQFKRATGISPWLYILRLKVDKAKELLLDPRNSVADVARIVGFSDPNYFSRVFSKTAGISPSAFRRNYL
ncbi:MAG: AraC family transcriptional regulator [bacterium]|nr:AraC family transcriptional regulator [bacterium]